MSNDLFCDNVLKFYQALPDDLALPDGIQMIYPFSNVDTIRVMRRFYKKYYADKRERFFIFGINPGRFGSGITGIGFTDPANLENKCGISNPFEKRSEISSDFMFDVISAYGGPTPFFADFYFTAVSPVGFLKDGKNYNYYDDVGLIRHLTPFLLACIRSQLTFGSAQQDIICIGQGKNLDFLQKLNKKHALFRNIYVLPHPRWVMQYRRKHKDLYIAQYLEVLAQMKL